MDNIKVNALKNSLSYDAYVELVGSLVDNGSTTGPNQSEGLVNYTKLNFKRMSRWNKTIKVSETLIAAVNSIPFDMKWAVISEAWCGDAAQNIPYIAQLAKASANVEMQIVLRDENLAFMDQYLTNGSRSIPKVVFMKADNLEDLATWGPRPKIVQEKVVEFKKEDASIITFEKFVESIHAWYAKDKNNALENELLVIFHSLKESITA